MNEEMIQQLAQAMAANGNVVTFATCNAHFNGSRESAIVEHFLMQADLHKTTHNMSDAIALKSFPSLLGPDAAVWWKGVQNKATTWQAAMDLLNQSFNPPVPSYVFLHRLFEHKQRKTESTDAFVIRQRALMAQMRANSFDELTALDIVYGALLADIRAFVPRDKVQSIDELLPLARIAEINRITMTSMLQENAATLAAQQGTTQSMPAPDAPRFRGHC